MQPYLFPYLGHFALIDRSDAWVVFDITQFKPKNWMNRNRLGRPGGGWTWFTAAVNHVPKGTKTCDVLLADPRATLETLRGQLAHFRRDAPHWAEVDDVVLAAFSRVQPGGRLVDLDVAALASTCEYLKIPFSPLVASAESWDLSEVNGPGDWAPVIASAIGADEYINPVSGAHLFDEEAFTNRGISLLYLVPPEFTYCVRGGLPSEKDLSVLDAMLWADVSSIRDALASGTVVPSTQARPYHPLAGATKLAGSTV
jgi:hypothetical protein